MSRPTEFYVNEQGWWTLRSYQPLGGRVVVDATEKMTPGLIDLSVTSVKGASAACAITYEAAAKLADELRRVVATAVSVEAAAEEGDT